MTIHALVVDDERLARRKIIGLLADQPDIEVVGECSDGVSAATQIADRCPDLVFLDIQMPELDGFEVLEEVGASNMPEVVFVTAYDEHALRAFEVAAVDYLLKPFARARFETAVARARARLEDRARTATAFTNLLGALEKPRYLERFIVRSTGRIELVDVRDIEWIEADGNYLRLHTDKRVHLARHTLNAVEAKLNPTRFLRIHRSRIVNVDRIQQLVPGTHGEYTFALASGVEVRSSRSCHARIQSWLGSGA